MPIPMQDLTDELSRLQDDWVGDLMLVLDEKVALVYGSHFIQDLNNRYRITRRKPRKAAEKKPSAPSGPADWRTSP